MQIRSVGVDDVQVRLGHDVGFTGLVSLVKANIEPSEDHAGTPIGPAWRPFWSVSVSSVSSPVLKSRIVRNPQPGMMYVHVCRRTTRCPSGAKLNPRPGTGRACDSCHCSRVGTGAKSQVGKWADDVRHLGQVNRPTPLELLSATSRRLPSCDQAMFGNSRPVKISCPSDPSARIAHRSSACRSGHPSVNTTQGARRRLKSAEASVSDASASRWPERRPLG
jgi:hypothetical protein